MNEAEPPRPDRRINHVEFVHRPGERNLVLALFGFLGFAVHEYANGEVLVAAIDPTTWDAAENDNYLASREVRPEQWRFDQALEQALAQEPLAGAHAGHRQLLAEKPQWGMHFGIRLRSVALWDDAVDRLGDIDRYAPMLSERVRLLRVFRPDVDGTNLHQAFFWTDLIASGSLAFGQNIELTTVMV
jgi:hypothetical protein